MVFEIAAKELKANIFSPKVLVTYVVCFVLIISAILTGASNYLALKEEATVQEAAERDRLSNIFNFQQDYLQTGIYMYRQPSLLSVLVSGVEGDSARRANLNNYTSPVTDVSHYNNNPILALFGLLDLEFIVKTILSLFAILFTYDTISGEREMGTLKLNLSNQVKRSTFIIGKLLGNFLLILLPFIIPLLLGLLILQFIPGIEFTGEDWIRTILLVFGFMLYLVAFYSLGIMVSSLTRSSNISFLILLMLWVVFIAIVPRVAVLTAQSIEPVESVDVVRMDIIKSVGPANRNAREKIMEQQQEFQAEAERRRPIRPAISTAERMAKYEQAMEEFRAWAQVEQEKLAKLASEVVREAYDEIRIASDKKIKEAEQKQDRQNQLAINMSRLASPAAAVTFLSNRLAKSGVYSSDKSFYERVRSLHQGFLDGNNQLLEDNPDYIQFGMNQTEPVDLSDYYPNMGNTSPETLEESLSAVISDFAALAFASILFIAIAFTAFLRYDVR
jgi:ABC-type transport system involved in multi-copper enzyme maturation permease subunit